MAARTRASFTDDDSLGERITLEMVHIDPPIDEQTALNESTATMTSTFNPNSNDLLTSIHPMNIDGEYEIPNLFTYRKVNQQNGIIKNELVCLDRSISRTNAT